jgi:hypothetical protein
MGDIDNPHDPPNKGEAHSHKGINRTQHQSSDEDFDEVGHGIPSTIGITEGWKSGIMEYWVNSG